MKVLKIILIVIVSLIALFFIIGLVKSEVHYGHEVTVNKSVQQAWAVSQDESKYDQWLAGFKSMELLSGEKGTEGSTYRIVVNPGHDQPDFEMIETVVSIQENDHVNMVFDNEMMEFEQVMTFRENEGKTTIKTESLVRGKGLMTRSTFALMEMLTGSFTAQEAENIEALKRVIEAS